MSVDTHRKCNGTRFRKMEEFRGTEPQRQLLHGSATPDTTVSSIFAYEHTEPHGGSARGLKMDCNNPKAGRDRELRVFPNLVSLLLFAVRFEFPPLTGRWLRFSGRTFVSARFYEFHVNSSKWTPQEVYCEWPKKKLSCKKKYVITW